MPPDSSWSPIDLGAAEHAKPTEPPYVCGILYRGKRHAISGPPEAAKTLTACILGLEHARAGEGRFALVDFESGPPAARLLLEDLGATVEEVGDVYYVQPESPPTPDAIEQMVAAGVTVAIIDAAAGAYDVSGLDDNKRSDSQKFARTWVDALWKLGVTVVLIDHVVKNAEARGKFAIGSERKLGTVDVHLGLTPIRQLHRGGDSLIRITTHKDRPGHLDRPVAAELSLLSDPDTHQISWTFRPPANEQAPDAWRPTVLMQRVSAFLEHQSEPVSRRTVEENVKGKSRTFLRQAMDALVEGGYANETLGSRGARMLTFARHFTSPDLAPTSPGEDGGDLAGPRPLLQEGEVRGEDEVERLLTKHFDIASGREFDDEPPLRPSPIPQDVGAAT